MAKFYKWNVDKIYFYPYGGATKFNEDINKPLFQELMILIMGPIFQIIFFSLLSNFLTIKELDLLSNYHYSILFFNLLPIYPLDGGKLVNIISNYFLSFKSSFNFTIFVSLITILIGFICLFMLDIKFSTSLFLVFVLIICKLTQEWRKKNYYFNKFILERYIKRFTYKKTKIVNEINQMSRDKKHLFFNNKRYYSENEILAKKFNCK